VAVVFRPGELYKKWKYILVRSSQISERAFLLGKFPGYARFSSRQEKRVEEHEHGASVE